MPEHGDLHDECGGYNVWADENPGGVETGSDSGTGGDVGNKSDTIDNEDVNPTYILQHYFDFREVRMDEKIDEEKSAVKLNIINTSKKNGILPGPNETKDNAESYLSKVSVVKDTGKLEVVPVLTKMFENEKARFLEKPRMMYMNHLYNSDGNIKEEDFEKHFNENYTLKEVWVHQPDPTTEIDPSSINANDPEIDKLTESDFIIYEAPKLYTADGQETDKHDPSRFIFTNNPDNPNLPKGELPHRVPAPERGKNHIIRIQTGTIIRLVFDVTEDENYIMPEDKDKDKEGVLFFDYDITDGQIYHDYTLSKSFDTSTQDTWENIWVDNKDPKWHTSYARTKQQGINSLENIGNSLADGNVQYGFGNANMGTGIGDMSWKRDEFSKEQTINKYNKNDDIANVFQGASFGLVTGLNQDGTLIWAPGIQAPAIFSKSDGIKGKTNYTKKQFSLVFHREGGTYTLSAVNKNGSDKNSEVAVGTLEQFKQHDCSTQKNPNHIIWANDFWPMDKATSYGSDKHDFKFGAAAEAGTYPSDGFGSKKRTFVSVGDNQSGTVSDCGNPPVADDAIDHNSYFGMEFHVDFVVDPGYVAPLRYFFYGDDDLWVFLSELDENGNIKLKNDGTGATESKLIADLGGVHSSIGEFVNLWDHIKPIPYGGQSKKYRLTFFYTERGASGSSCYMRFSLPFKSLITDPPSYANTLRIEKKVETVDPVMDPIDEKEEFVFQLGLFNEYGTELVNRYPYKRYKTVVDPDTGEETTEEIKKSQDYMYSNAKFKLRSGEYIEVASLPAGTTYRVEELNRDIEDKPREYVSTTFYTSAIENGDSGTVERVKSGTGSVVSGSVNDNKITGEKKENYVTFINARYPGSMTLEKKVEKENAPVTNQQYNFKILLTKDGKSIEKLPYRKFLPKSEENKEDETYIPVGEEEILLPNEKKEFSIKLSAGEKVIFYNLPEGTKYTIVEEEEQNYVLGRIEINGKKVINPDDNSISGILEKPENTGTEPASLRDEIVFVNTFTKFNIRKTQYVGENEDQATKDLLSVKPGEEITYCLTVTNGSDQEATNVVVTDTIPEGLILKDRSISDGGKEGENRVITWNLGTLEGDGEKTVRFTVIVPEVEKATRWRNIAYVTKGDPEEDPKIPSNPVEAVPGIIIEKTQQLNGEGKPTKDLLHVKEDDKVTYYLTVTNTSKAMAFDVDVKDTVPTDDAGNELKLVENSVKGGISHTVTDNKDITWKLGNLKAGEIRTVEFTVIVPAGGTYWINGASTSYIPPDPKEPEKPGPEKDRTPDIPSNKVEIEKPEINITKTQYVGDNDTQATKDLLSVKPGEEITYCLTVSNGSDQEATNVVVTDTIPEGLSLKEISDGGVVGENGVISWNLGILGADQERTVQFTVIVPEVEKATRWRNIAYVTKGDPGEEPEIPSNPVEAVPGITIEKTQQLNGEGKPTKDLLHVKENDRVTYYLTITNTSKATAFDVTVKDTVPTDDAGNELKLVENSVKGGISHTVTDNKDITWKLGNLKAGEIRTVEFTVIVPAGGTHWINGASTNYIPPDPENPDEPAPEDDRTPDIPSNEVEIEKPEINIQKTQYIGNNAAGETDQLLNVKPGDVITYCLTVSNGSDKDATDVIVTDQIPEGLTLVNGSISDGGVLGSDDIITWNLGTLKAHGSRKVQFKATVPQVDQAAKWTNIAYVTSGNPDPDPEEDPKTPSNPVEAIPGITIEKTQQLNGEGEPTKDLLHVKKDDRVTYYLTVTNTSEATAFDVDVKDTVPTDNAGNKLDLVTESVQGGIRHSISADGRNITWELGDLKAGESRTVEFTVIVPAGGTHWINGASTNYIPPDPENPGKPGPEEDRTPDIPSNEVEIEKPEINIQKTQYIGNNAAGETKDLLSVKPGDVITYCLTVSNGSDKDATDVIVTDQIPDGLTLVNGSISDGGTVGSDQIITWKLGTLKAHDSKKVQFKATVPQVDQAARWTNIAYVTSGNPDPDPEEDPKTPSNEVEAIPGITIEKTQQRNGEGEPTKNLLHVKKDDQVTYYLTVTNTSDATAFDVDVKDMVPTDDAGNELGLLADSVKGGESHEISGREITWHLGDLTPGASEVVEFTVVVPAGGTHWINGASTSYIPPDPEDPGKPGPEEDRTPDIPSNEVEIDKPEIKIRKTQYVGDNADQATADLLSVKPGDVITYCLTVTNESDREATDVIVTDQIPEGLTLVNGSVSDGGTVGRDGIITWNLGTIGAHGEKRVTFKVTVPQTDQSARWRNIAYVTSGNPDPDPEEDPKTPSNEVEAIPGITIEKTQQRNGEGEPTKNLLHVKADDRVTYYLTITNTSDATAFDVMVKDTIPTDNAGNELQLVADSVKGGTGHEINGREITWTLGDLKAGEKQTVEFTVTVPVGGTHWINGASTNYIPPDPEDPEKPSPDPERTPDIPSNEVEIDKSDANVAVRKLQSLNGGEATPNVLNVKPDDVITYRLMVSNESENPVDDVIVTDPVPEGLLLDEGSIVPEGTIETSQNGQQTITWKLGTLQAGEEKTLEFKVTVPKAEKAARWTNIAYVTEGDPDPDPEEDPKTPSNEVEAVPGIAIEKEQQVNGQGEPTKETLHVQKGDQVTYYLTVTNISEAKAFDVIVKDQIPEDSAGNQLELVEGSVEGGESHTVSGRVITWNVGDLEAGQSQTLKFTVKVPSDGSRWKNIATTSYVPGDPDDPENPDPENPGPERPNPDDPEPERTPDIPSNEVEIEAGTTRIQLRARKVLNGANLINGQFTFRIQGISAEIIEEAENETERSETSQKPEEAGEATPSNAERQESETGDSGGESGGLLRIGGKTVTSKVLFQARALVKGDEMSVGNHTVPMPAVNTATNNEDGEILFGEIEYSLPGTYTYKITEVRENRRGYTFDTTEYIVEVLVTRDDATGELRAQVQIVKPEGADEILFTNRYRRSGGGGGGNPGGGGGGDPQPGPGTDPTPENPDTPNPDPTPENPENPQPTPDTPASVLPDPNDPNSPPTVTIEENGVPRTYVKVWDPVNEEFIYIPEEDVPLFGLLPKTGEEDRRRWLGVLLALSLAGIGTLTMEERRRKKKE